MSSLTDNEKLMSSTLVCNSYGGYHYKLHPSSYPHWFCCFSHNHACYAITDDFGNLRRVSPYFKEGNQPIM